MNVLLIELSFRLLIHLTFYNINEAFAVGMIAVISVITWRGHFTLIGRIESVTVMLVSITHLGLVMATLQVLVVSPHSNGDDGAAESQLYHLFESI